MLVPEIFFYFSSFLIFFFEGVSLTVLSESIITVLFLNLAVLINWLNFGKIYFPKKTTSAYLVFLAFSFLSLAVNRTDIVSLRAIIFSFSGFWLLVFGYQNKGFLRKTFLYFLLIVCLFFSLTSYLGIFFSAIRELFVRVATGSSYFFITQFVHNHLGDWLGLAIVITIFFINEKPRRLWPYLLTIIFLPLFFLSQSRSAFLALMVTVFLTILINKTSQKISKIIVGVLIIVSVLFLLITIKEVNFWPIKNLRRPLLEKKLIVEKSLVNMRDQYFSAALKGFISSPILGVGPGQYYLLSKKYSNGNYQVSGTSHNMFLDLLSERGLLGLLAFLFFLYLILRGKRNIYFWLLIYLLINFQTDYTFTLAAFQWVFFILASLNLKDENVVIDKKVYYLFLSVCFIFNQLFFID